MAHEPQASIPRVPGDRIQFCDQHSATGLIVPPVAADSLNVVSDQFSCSLAPAERSTLPDHVGFAHTIVFWN
jgi:hypothetical protein